MPARQPALVAANREGLRRLLRGRNWLSCCQIADLAGIPGSHYAAMARLLIEATAAGILDRSDEGTAGVSVPVFRLSETEAKAITSGLNPKG